MQADAVTGPVVALCRLNTRRRAALQQGHVMPVARDARAYPLAEVLSFAFPRPLSLT
jgi:hypothetical protein